MLIITLNQTVYELPYKLKLTGNTLVLHSQELLVSARIAERRGADNERALPTSCACAIQQEVYVDVAVARVWNAAACRQKGVVSAVACPFEDQDSGRRTGDCQNSVVAGDLLYARWRYRRQVLRRMKKHCRTKQ